MIESKNIHGFEFVSEREIPEIKGVLREAVYKKNGARLLFLDREDNNKTFAISFKTIPEDDTGVFHIIEHSVLCGSEKYPVKEPFVELLKGSLKTFLNAFTFPDKTMYPVSSRNNKDFFNLVDIYMDAVLHPLAVKRPEIFYQEGWHYELHRDSDEMIYKGVVFNEMKGAYSSADELEMEEMSSLLYKGSCYARDSGGNPSVIPMLTFEKFKESHAKYYHPSNAVIILDGSVDLEKTLKLLDSFLSEYDALEIDTDIPMIAPAGHTEKTVHYEIAPGEDPSGKARVCLGYMTADFSDRRLIAALAILTDAIAGSNDSPYKKAMLDSGLCEDVSFISYDGIQQNSLLIEIKNVKEENIEAVKRLSRDVLSEIVKKGIDKNALTASFNMLEFRVREQDMATFPAGIAYAISALDTYLYGGDPKTSLSFEEDIEYLRGQLDGDYYEKLIEKYILSSPHSATLYMLPSATLGEERERLEKEKLKKIKAGMSDVELKETIAKTEALEEWQRSEDTPEALETLPKLSISDISELPEKYPTVEYEIQKTPALYTESNSRGIIYTNLLFDISDFSTDELFYVSLLTELYKNVRTDKSNVVELQTKIKTELGSFAVGTLVGSKNGVVTPYVNVSISSLKSKLDSAVDIAKEVLLGSEFSDTAAVGKIIKQMKSMDADAISASGHSAAFSRAAAYVSAEAAVGEYLDGIECYLKLKELDKNYKAVSTSLSESLTKTAKKIFVRGRLTACHSGERCDEFIEQMILAFMPSDRINEVCKIGPLGARREGILIPASISFASMAGNVLNYEDKISGSLAVARSILSFGYLWNTIRVQGGAYGAGFIRRNSGVVGYYTYRDPDANRSLKCFRESSDYLRAVAASGESIENFIIGAVGDSDPLITPKVMGALAIGAYIRGESYENRALRRNEMLKTGPDDLVRIADLLDKVTVDSGVCVVGGRDKLYACGDEIETIIEI
ncbi:MAG: insulinase family protein [Clostridia bacterium]|nr:insulinase family protein [Clostridia bacterium]